MNPFRLVLQAIGLVALFLILGFGVVELAISQFFTLPKSAPEWPSLNKFEANAATTAFVTATWPKVKTHCPGFERFGGDMTFIGLRDMRNPAMGEMARLDIQFKIAEDPKRIPATFRAFGHTCGYGVSPDGKTLRIQKEMCASVCLGKAFSSDRDYLSPL